MFSAEFYRLFRVLELLGLQIAQTIKQRRPAIDIWI